MFVWIEKRFSCLVLSYFLLGHKALRILADDLFPFGDYEDKSDRKPQPSSPGGSLYIEDDLKWPGGVVHYRVEDNGIDEAQMNNLTTALEFVHDRTCVKFKPCTGKCDFLVKIKNGRGGCISSSLGRNKNGTQHVSLGAKCWNQAIIVHELMHVLGLGHEQQRIDRDSYITILHQKIRESFLGGFEIKAKNAMTLGKFDFGSVMMYPAFHTAVSKTSSKEHLIVSRYGGACIDRMGQRDKPSGEDVRKINLLYDCKDLLKEPCTLYPDKQVIGTISAVHQCFHAADCCDACSISEDCLAFAVVPSDPGTCLLYATVDRIEASSSAGMLAGVPRGKADRAQSPKVQATGIADRGLTGIRCYAANGPKIPLSNCSSTDYACMVRTCRALCEQEEWCSKFSVSEEDKLCHRIGRFGPLGNCYSNENAKKWRSGVSKRYLYEMTVHMGKICGSEITTIGVVENLKQCADACSLVMISISNLHGRARVVFGFNSGNTDACQFFNYNSQDHRCTLLSTNTSFCPGSAPVDPEWQSGRVKRVRV